MTGLEIALISGAVIAAAAGTGVAVNASVQQKKAAENAALAARKNAKMEASLRGARGRETLRQQLAEANVAAASGVGILGSGQETTGIESTRNILGQIRDQNFQSFSQAQMTEQQLLNTAFGAEQQAISTGLEGTSSILGTAAAGVGKLNRKPPGVTSGFEGKNNMAVNTTQGFSTSNIA